MSDVTKESWKGHVIHIRTIPVRQIVTRMSTPDGYIAIVRIDQNDELLADWHLPRFSERWTSAAEAQRDAVEYAVKLIDRGVLGAIEAQGALAT
ncbi:hypothetical protein A6V36_33355 [Paraburkholderia ginsengiterrae]|uniref:DUF6566 domain-containing protein n=1 Tax=Paraburkholderia ginsengiterrae TaxID=1462993 RepID=A0A1A9N2G5_9BURK|nr:DUF6566 family protein [Paraburkholderia ginsengiterrae]OAJ56458.1 hypothetical protein A6V37_31645 [Paraburkholderia ginsengiterrae]OAJ56614.1 hypothetical protein A6V36_33355 [Paraburkholderia ginsengiterrae]